MITPFTRDLDKIHTQPFIDLDSPDHFQPSSELGISKHRARLGKSATLDSLLVNKKSKVLLVSCHGALDREQFTIPRFERLRTFLSEPYSSLYFSDPTLHSSKKLTLGWYTGWKDLNLYPVLAQWVRQAAEVSGATKIIFVGSSGGGYASLQIAPYIPGSMVIPLNPQTSIFQYRVKERFGHQRAYLRYVMPHLIPKDGVRSIGPDFDWSVPLGERASLVRKYEQPHPNYVLYVQNVNDTQHFNRHYQPFREMIEKGPNKNRVRFCTYEGPHKHQGPKPIQIREYITEALRWLTEIQEN